MERKYNVGRFVAEKGKISMILQWSHDSLCIRQERMARSLSKWTLNQITGNICQVLKSVTMYFSSSDNWIIDISEWANTTSLALATQKSFLYLNVSFIRTEKRDFLNASNDRQKQPYEPRVFPEWQSVTFKLKQCVLKSRRKDLNIFDNKHPLWIIVSGWSFSSSGGVVVKCLASGTKGPPSKVQAPA